MRALITLFITLALIANFSVGVAHAETTDSNSVYILQPDVVSGQTQESNLGHYLNLLFKTLIGLAGGLSVLIITVSGLQYILSEIPGVKTSAKERITEAMVGLILALAAYLILYTINPDLVNLDLELDQINKTATP